MNATSAAIDFKKAIEDAGSDNHEVFGGAWTGGYHIQQEPEEFAELLAVLSTELVGCERYLQIGIAAGGAERLMCKHMGILELLVIDDGKHPNNVVWRRQNKTAIESLDVRVSEFIGDSHGLEAARFLAERGFDFFQLIGIDGDHSPGGVRMDWALVQPFIPKGGMVWFHDINLLVSGETGARELWPKVKADPAFEVLLETKGKFGIGLVRKI